jgi:hypothetical protein
MVCQQGNEFDKADKLVDTCALNRKVYVAVKSHGVQG